MSSPLCWTVAIMAHIPRKARTKPPTSVAESDHTSPLPLLGGPAPGTLLAMVWDSALDVNVRDDLVEAQDLAWNSIGERGTWWTGAERVELAKLTLDAVTDPDPLAPWAARSSVADRPAFRGLPDAAVDAAYRLARSPGTLTEDWYHSVIDRGLTPCAYVELVTIVVRVASIQRFAAMLGTALPPLPEPETGQPSQLEPSGLGDHHHWVPVVRPDDAGGELS